jgi:hypothetical protein
MSKINYYQRIKKKCTCGIMVGQYSIKRHTKTWEHAYYSNTLAEYNLEQEKLQSLKLVENNNVVKIENYLETL